MEMLKNKMTIGLIIMVLGVSYIGAIDNNHLEENDENLVQVNA